LLSKGAVGDSKESKDVSCETITGLQRRKFDTLKDYNIWCKETVDPFITKLKKALINAKPESIESFVIGYCAREAMGRPQITLPELPSVARKALQMGKKVEFDEKVSLAPLELEKSSSASSVRSRRFTTIR
jgi:hypothetical protein